MEFDINSYQGSNTAMCCRSYEEVICFAEYLDSVGRQWCNGKSYTDHNPQYQLVTDDDGFCFIFNEGFWDHESVLKNTYNKECQIIYFSDFSWDTIEANLSEYLEASSEMDVFLSQFTP